MESPSASTLYVKWSNYSGATVYLLDLRVVNSTTFAPVVVMTTAPRTERLVQGLQPGHHYQITLKVFQYTAIVCTDVMEAITGKEAHTKGMKKPWLKCTSFTPTVPAASQITSSRAISSTSISFEWSDVTGADSYILFVEKLFSSPLEQYNRTFKNLSGQIEGLAPSTTYNCYLYSSNSAGRGAKSNTKSIMTCK